MSASGGGGDGLGLVLHNEGFTVAVRRDPPLSSTTATVVPV
jgi:hypothetical protein